jgi:hypothetical protein
MSIPGIPDALDGSLDGVVDGSLCGWARDTFLPDATVEVEVLVDGEVVGRSVCDRFRTDLAKAGMGSGRYGFEVPLGDDWHDGEIHEVRARATGTDLELDNSPIRMVLGMSNGAPRPGPFAADTVLGRRGSLEAVRRRMAVRGRIAVMACFQPAAPTPAYLRRYLAALRDMDVAVVLVDASPVPMDVDTDLAPLVLNRANVGWDFASWLAGLHEIRELAEDAQELLLTNDSVFGPLFPLQEAWDSPRVRDADVWGITDSWEIRYHLQSYFLLLRRRALTHPAFWRFLEAYSFPPAKRQVVRDGEVGITTALLAAGLSSAALCPYEEVGRRWLDDLPSRLANIRALPENVFLGPAELETAVRGRSAAQSLRHVLQAAHHIRRGIPVNGSHFFWDVLLRDFRCPFLKRDLLLTNPAELPYATDVREILEELTDYDPELIRESARLMRGARVATI